MKRLIPTIAIILGWAVAASAATPGTLTSLRAIRSITNEQASQALPVAFEATVTYFREYAHFLIVQDGDMAVFIRANTNARLIPGDRSPGARNHQIGLPSRCAVQRHHCALPWRRAQTCACHL